VNFLSDNAWGAWPEMFAAIERASKGSQPSYGDDDVTARLEARFSDPFASFR
jgi:threonine aldolase